MEASASSGLEAYYLSAAWIIGGAAFFLAFFGYWRVLFSLTHRSFGMGRLRGLGVVALATAIWGFLITSATLLLEPILNPPLDPEHAEPAPLPDDWEDPFQDDGAFDPDYSN